MDEGQRITAAIITVFVSTGIGLASGATGISVLGGFILAALIYNAKPKERG